MKKLAIIALLLAGCSRPDLILHGAAGAGATAMTKDEGCAVALAIGVAKEVIDPVFSTLDVIATVAGCYGFNEVTE